MSCSGPGFSQKFQTPTDQLFFPAPPPKDLPPRRRPTVSFAYPHTVGKTIRQLTAFVIPSRSCQYLLSLSVPSGVAQFAGEEDGLVSEVAGTSLEGRRLASIGHCSGQAGHSKAHVGGWSLFLPGQVLGRHCRRVWRLLDDPAGTLAVRPNPDSIPPSTVSLPLSLKMSVAVQTFGKKKVCILPH